VAACSVGHLLPVAKENRWIDLPGVFIEAPPPTASPALGLQPPLSAPRVQREARGSGKDRIDLLVWDRDVLRAVVEVKVLSGLGRRQLDRYRDAHPDAGAYLLVFSKRLPLHLHAGSGWTGLTWDDLLTAFGCSPNACFAAWVAPRTAGGGGPAGGGRPPRDAALRGVGPNTGWNDLGRGRAFVFALRAGMSWVYGRLHPPTPIDHDLVESAAGVSWVP